MECEQHGCNNKNSHFICDVKMVNLVLFQSTLWEDVPPNPELLLRLPVDRRLLFSSQGSKLCFIRRRLSRPSCRFAVNDLHKSAAVIDRRRPLSSFGVAGVLVFHY